MSCIFIENFGNIKDLLFYAFLDYSNNKQLFYTRKTGLITSLPKQHKIYNCYTAGDS